MSILWPPAAPWREEGPGARWWWLATCLLGVFPVTAVLHNALFYRASCLLNPFGPEYTPDVIWQLISRDPSLAWAVAAMAIVHQFGQHRTWVRLAMAPLFLAFLPTTLWIWDIPCTDRWLCDTWHDGRLVIAELTVRTTHFYIVSLVLYAVLFGITASRKGPPASQTLAAGSPAARER